VIHYESWSDRLPFRSSDRVELPSALAQPEGRIVLHSAGEIPYFLWSFLMTGRPLRVRPAHIEWVADRLGERDRAILGSVNQLRLLSSLQLEHLHFADLAEPGRGRIRRRVLARLVEWRVLCVLERRIGGVRAGSSDGVCTGHRE